ncbi:MAG TPA: DUF3592 domain-containing protein [Woeseiaceae bacterium]|nr:DUF3592 domain-containing protein [Woeseiaceae bacterium]
MSNAAKNIIILLVVLLMAAGITYFYGRYDEHMSAVSRASLEWPSVTGLVTHSNLDTRRTKVGSQRHKTRHRVEVSYEYVVDGHRYVNDVVRFNQSNLSRKEKEHLVSTHPVGRQVEVFYDPSDPEESVLVRGSYP